YSLSQAADGHSLRISVKHEKQGVVSSYLHGQVKEGSVLDVFPPAGHFTLDASGKPLVLLAGGVGITPLMAMLQTALDAKRDITLVHCTRSPELQPFRTELLRLVGQYPNLKLRISYEFGTDIVQSEGTQVAVGRPDVALLRGWLPAQSDVH